MSKLSDCDKDIRDLKRCADELERTLDNVKEFAPDKSWRGRLESVSGSHGADARRRYVEHSTTRSKR